MNVAHYRKTILYKGIFEQLVVYPYLTNELKGYATVIAISDQVTNIEDVTHRNQRIATVIPYMNSVKETLIRYREEIIERQKVNATVYSIYTFEDTKILQLSK